MKVYKKITMQEHNRILQKEIMDADICITTYSDSLSNKKERWKAITWRTEDMIEKSMIYNQYLGLILTDEILLNANMSFEESCKTRLDLFIDYVTEKNYLNYSSSLVANHKTLCELQIRCKLIQFYKSILKYY